MTKEALDTIVAISSIATPIVLLALAAIGWIFRSRVERRFALEDKLRDDRVETYYQILEPYIIMFMADAAWNSDPKNKNKSKFDVGSRKMLSLEYRKQGFRLALFGSDEVMRSYNKLMQYFFTRDANSPVTKEVVRDSISMIGELILEIRRSVGNSETKLDRLEMLEWFLSEMDEYRN